MRFLGIGPYGDLGDIYLRLLAQGHEVKIHITEEGCQDVLQGLVPHVADWRDELGWIGAAGSDGIILFEAADAGGTQDALRAEGYNVIGGSAYGDRLENDRAFGQAVLAELGMKVAPIQVFDDFDRGIAFIRETKRRYVYKPNGSGNPTRTYIGEMADGADLIVRLDAYRLQWKAENGKPDFILMPHLAGVEVGIGAYFDGNVFLSPACIDWEHKRFFPGDLGEQTGEMGTLVSYRGTDRLFQASLARLAPRLKAGGYCGYINLNMIVNDDGLWPLEFTSRFGYPGSAILGVLQSDGWAALFSQMVRRESGAFRTHPGYALGVVLTVPPFPHRAGYAELSKGLPILFHPTLTEADRDRLHFCEVAKCGDRLVTAGLIGQIMVVTGRADRVEEAQRQAYERARQVVLPNLRYRIDIGDRFIHHDRATLDRLGLFGESCPA